MSSIKAIRKEFKIKPLGEEHWDGFYSRCKREREVLRKTLEISRKKQVPSDDLVLPICHQIWNAYHPKKQN